MSGLVWVLLFRVGSGSGIKLSETSPSGFGVLNTSLDPGASKMGRKYFIELYMANI